MSGAGASVGLIVLATLVVVVVLVLRSVVRVPTYRAALVERFGRYHATLPAGLGFVVPFVDVVRHSVDLREAIIESPANQVITADNLTVLIDLAAYHQVVDPVAATYEMADHRGALERIAVTTLRQVVGGMSHDEALASTYRIQDAVHESLVEAGERWGVRVNRTAVAVKRWTPRRPAHDR